MAASIDVSDLELQTITGTAAAPVVTSVVTPNGTTAIFRIEAATGGLLENGNYRARLLADRVVNGNDEPLTDHIGVPFSVLRGDANSDRMVDITDLATLATYWQQSGKSFAQGNFDYQGGIDISDLALLANNWQKTLPPPPDQPGVLRVGLPTADSLTLNWADTSPNALGYRVQRIEQVAGENVIAETEFTRTMLTDGNIANGEIRVGIVNWTDTGLQRGTQYTYRVQAYGNGFDTPYGSPASAITQLQRITDLSATAPSSHVVNLTWTDLATNEDGYHVYRSLTGSANPAEWDLIHTTGPGAQSYQDNTVPHSRTTYYYKVVAFNSVTESFQSNVTEVTTPANSPHGAGTFDWHATTMQPASPHQLIFTFDQDVRASVSSSDLLIEIITGVDDLTTKPTVLSMNWDAGTQVTTAVFSIGTEQAATILPDGNYRATIAAEDVINADGDPLANDVVVDFFVLAADANHDRSVNITDLSILATNWQQAPRSFSQGNYTYFDDVVDITDLALNATNWQRTIAQPPGAPGEVSVSLPTTGSLTLNWLDDSPLALGYRIQRSTTGDNFQVYTSFTRQQLEQNGMLVGGCVNWTDSGVAQGMRYWYRVRAFDDNNGHDTAYTPKKAGTTLLANAGGLSAIADPTQAAINVSWTDNAENEAGYRVYRSLNGGPNVEDWMVVGTTGPSAESYSDTTVGFGIEYYYKVEAFNYYITSGQSNIDSDTTPTLQAAMTNTISGLIANKPLPSVDPTVVDLFTIADHSSTPEYPNGHYVRNPDLWAAGVDLSGIPVWNEHWGSLSPAFGALSNGYLVTPRHLITAAHFGHHKAPDWGSFQPGTEVRFVDMDNNVVVATVVDNNPNDEVGDPTDPHQPNPPLPDFNNGIEIPGTDIRIYELKWTDQEPDLPPNIKPAKVFPSNLADFLPALSDGIPVAGLDQERKLHIYNWNGYASYSSTGPSFVRAVQPSGTAYDEWYELPIDGDSGSAVLAIVGSTPVVLGTWYTGQTASDISSNLIEINAILGAGYSLSELHVG